ncbi:NAD-P-binding protein [Trametes coccinea BRFM310]|uniref:NAD-P-binding protein n=1 Tax=Trametes coccinea (strain BRFM310) TaxID=1353009 RepID=A0A1Y2IWK7_TRAC3|nr:NAD-P-binding protein [Trametes coccinea BRFM310]
MSDTQIWLITGTSRGIGLELVKQLAATPSYVVIATCRNPTKALALKELADAAKGRIHIVALDVTDDKSVKESVAQVTAIVGSHGIDYLVSNAGINDGGDDRPSLMDLSVLQHVFDTNVVAPARIYQAYLPLVMKSTKKTIVNVSSALGSITLARGPIYTSYSTSKAALNMLTYKEHAEHPDLTVISMQPGHLKTDLGGPSAQLDVDVGVAGVLNVVKSLKPDDSGKFFDYQGKELPW